jgi:uncharacterized protein (TIGR02246 family)
MGTAMQATALTTEDEAAIRAVIGQLEVGWNAGDGAAFGAPFAEDADYVIIDGRPLKGRAVIAAGHQGIFDTYYRGSINHGTIERLRLIQEGVALAHVRWHLRFQAGGAEREEDARTTLVLVKVTAGWQITAFQNTRIFSQEAPHPFVPEHPEFARGNPA